MGPQRWLILMTFVLCIYHVKSKELKPVQVVYNQKEGENVCYCRVAGKIIRIGVVYKPCDEKGLIKGIKVMNLIERKQEIAVFSPRIRVHSEVCESVNVKEGRTNDMAEAEIHCEWRSRPERSHVGCVCVTFPFGMVETQKEEKCEDNGIGNTTLILDFGNDNQTESMLPATAFVDKEALITAVPFIVELGTDTTAEITEKQTEELSTKPILTTTISSDLPFEPIEPSQNIEMLFTVAALMTTANKIVVERSTTNPIVKTKEFGITITPSTETIAINGAEMTNDKSVNSSDVTKHKSIVHEPKSDNENDLFNIQSIKDKIKTLMKKVVYSDIPSNSDLDTVTEKFKKEIVKEIADNAANITKNVCPFNAAEAVKTLKELKGEYDMLKFTLGQSFGYAMTAFVSVLLTLCSVFAMAVFMCICLPLILKKGQNKLTKVMLIQPAEFVSVSSRDQETESEVDESIV